MAKATEYRAPFGIGKIRELLPHSYPFLMIDRVLELVPGKSVKAEKCVTVNEPWAQGHFPDRPVMPGVLMIEALAQAGGIVLMSQPEHRGKSILLAGVRSLRLRRLVEPGDVLTIETELQVLRMGAGRSTGTITVGGELALKGTIQFAMINS